MQCRMRTPKPNPSDALVMCADCMFWDNSNCYNVFPDELKGKYGQCKNDGFSYDYPVEGVGRADMLIYADYEGFSAGFDTGADFACIHGRKRIEENNTKINGER